MNADRELIGFLIWAAIVAFLMLVVMTTGNVEDNEDD